MAEREDPRGGWAWHVAGRDGEAGAAGWEKRRVLAVRRAHAEAARLAMAEVHALCPEGLTAPEAAGLLGVTSDTIRAAWETRGHLTRITGAAERPRYSLLSLLEAERRTRATGRIPGTGSAYTGRTRLR